MQAQLQLQQIHRQSPGLISRGLVQGLLQQLVRLLGILGRQPLRHLPESGRVRCHQQHRRRFVHASDRGLMLRQLIQPTASVHQFERCQGHQIAIHQPPQGQRRLAMVQGRCRRLPAQAQPLATLITGTRADPVQHHRRAVRRPTGEQGPGRNHQLFKWLGRFVVQQQLIPDLLLSDAGGTDQRINAGLFELHLVGLQQPLLEAQLRHRLRRG